MKIGKILWLVLALVIGMPGVSMAGEGHAGKNGRHVASTKSKKKAKKGKGAKHARGKKKGKAGKGKKGAKAHKGKKAKKAGASHQSHAPAEGSVHEPVPGMDMPAAQPKDDLPPPNNGNLPE